MLCEAYNISAYTNLVLNGQWLKRVLIRLILIDIINMELEFSYL